MAAMLGLPMQDAHALTLGRLTVQSALGEPLRAEIDVPEISAEEAATLQTSIAAPEAFRAAGLEYHAALQGVRITPQRRADGRLVLRLASDAAVNAPFVDLILQVNWASGRVVRDYTILLDPPATRQTAPGVTIAPQVTPAQTPATAPAAATAAAPTPSPAPGAAPASPPAAEPATPPAAPSAPASALAPAPAPLQAPASGEAGSPTRPTPAPPAATASPRPAPTAPAPAAAASQVLVKPGDTAGRIAAARKAPNVSLDQMLVAMLRSNPEAFVQGNVNRVKAGAVLEIPTAEQAAGVPPAEAAQTITAQSSDFNAFRSRLAANAPAVQTDTAQRSASGRVQAQVQDDRPANAAPDRLTLSKGGVQAKAAEERIAREKSAQEATERVAELSRTINELNQLGVASGTPAAPAAPTGGEPAASASAEAAASAAPAAPASAGIAAESASSAPAVTAALPAASAPEPAAGSTGWVDRLLGNPLVPAAAGALVALLAGFGLYRARQRRKAQAAAQSADGAPQMDSFFAASGGQHVDTSVPEAAALSAVDPVGPLDGAGDADPVAQADVYLAYGRDLQAEEILTEALRATPERLAIHAKLAEVYAKRRDIPAFEVLAAQAHALSGGAGPEWARITELGRTLLPNHRLWPDQGADAAVLAGAGLATGAAALAGRADDAASAPAEVRDADAGAPISTPPAAALDFGLDLDLDLDPTTPPGTPLARAATPAQDVAAAEPSAVEPADNAAAVADLVPPPPLADDLDFDIDVDAPPATAGTPAGLAGTPAPLDLGSLSLDLGDPPAADATTAATELPDVDDPLATKLALAEEFNAIGDTDGARALAEEVLAEAAGPLKAQAERFLADLA